MIPSAITMELKYGLLCSTGEDICLNGQFPLLRSTERLLGKLGFQICNDLKNLENNGDTASNSQQSSLLAALIHPSDDTPPPSDSESENESERLSDALLRALDDVRDLRHQIEEEDEKGKKISRRSKNFKVDTLEKSRAKMLEKQRRSEIEEVVKDGVDADNDYVEIRHAWIRMARTLNSARLLLFLISEEAGLDMLANCDEEDGLKNIRKIIIKLSDALIIFAMSSKSIEPIDKDQSLPRKEIRKWEDFILEGVRSRRGLSTISRDADSDGSEKDTGVVNQSVIDLTDDSIASSNINDTENEGFVNSTSSIDLTEDSFGSGNQIEDASDENSLENLSEEITENVIHTDTQTQPKDVSDVKPKNSKKQKEMLPSQFISWNCDLDKFMNDLLSAMNAENKNEGHKFMEDAFVNDGDSSAIAVHERAKSLDEKFSLVVGVSGSKEYQKRKEYLMAIEKLRYRIEQKIRQGRKNHEFEDARLDVYGSCLSGLSLGKNADVDLSLRFSLGVKKKLDFEAGDLTAKKYARHVTDTVYKIKRKLESSQECCDIEAVPRARVPVIKGVYLGANNPHSEDGSLHFDICLLNDIAVANSGLIKEYSDVDNRVKSLMIAVKRWTKDNKINSAADNTLSSYTWINLVIFYLQCIGFVPNLQCPTMMRECNHEMGWGQSRRRQDNINNLNTAYLKWNGQADRVWKRSKEVDQLYASVSLLLYGFFRFYSREFPIHLYLVSIKRGGNIRIPKTMFSDRASLHLCIEDPFETYDSHFPHDLGVPADEKGSMLISRCFRHSEEHLRGIIFGKDRIEELWPITTIENDTPARSRKNRNSKAEVRAPEMTLVIEVPRRDYKKEEIRKIFQPFADKTGSRIVGFSLVRGGRLAFVDYDSIEAVNAALAEHARNPLEIKGTALSVSPKAVAPKKPSSDNNNKAKTPPKEARNEKNKQSQSDGGKNDPKMAKGNPDLTLIVQSSSGQFSEKGLAKIFRPFAEKTKSKLVVVYVTKKKRKAFVEYDSPDAVKAALAGHAKSPLFWNGKVLDVSQKVSPSSKQREKSEKTQQKVNQNASKNTPSTKGGKKQQGKKKQGGMGKEQNAKKPMIDANQSIEGQI